jgi:uncharacterized protein YegL
MKHIIVLIDTSYSMKPQSNGIIKGLNKFILDLKAMKDSNEIFLTVMFFSDKTYYSRKVEHILESRKFSIEDIPPYGSTFLYDAVGEILDDFLPSIWVEHYFFIITDGCDTGSVKTGEWSIKRRCEEARRSGWTITHCGVNSGNLGTGVTDIIFKEDGDNLDILLEELKI